MGGLVDGGPVARERLFGRRRVREQQNGRSSTSTQEPESDRRRPRPTREQDELEARGWEATVQARNGAHRGSQPALDPLVVDQERSFHPCDLDPYSRHLEASRRSGDECDRPGQTEERARWPKVRAIVFPRNRNVEAVGDLEVHGDGRAGIPLGLPKDEARRHQQLIAAPQRVESRAHSPLHVDFVRDASAPSDLDAPHTPDRRSPDAGHQIRGSFGAGHQRHRWATAEAHHHRHIGDLLCYSYMIRDPLERRRSGPTVGGARAADREREAKDAHGLLSINPPRNASAEKSAHESKRFAP